MLNMKPGAMRGKIWRTGAISLASLTLGCPNDVKKPPPPDVRDLVERYASPTAPLNDQTIVIVQEELQQTLDSLRGFCGWSQDVVDRLCVRPANCTACLGLNPITDTFSAMGDAGVAAFEEKIKGLTGFAQITHVCRGWGLRQTNDIAENGYVNLTVGFSEEGIDAAFGGKVVGCKTLFDGVQVTINATLDFAFKRRFPLNEILNPELEPIVRVVGEVDKGNGQTTTFLGSLQLAPEGGVGQTAVSFDVADAGTMLLLVGPRETGLSASNGVFGCDVTNEVQLTCKNVDTGEQVP